MKLLVLGATGATGRLLLDQTLRSGHDVTALARTPSALDDLAGRIRVVRGDATVTRDLTDALTGHEVIVSALGSGRSVRSDIASRAAAAVVEAAERTGARRLVWLSAYGVGEGLRRGSTTQKVLYGTFMRSLFADKARAEQFIRSSTLDWTLVQPVVLTHGPATGAYRAAERLPMKGLPTTSRADVADFMLTAAYDTARIRRTAVVSG